MTLQTQFKSVFGVSAAVHAKAPGRVNLIGEHTDYNDGFVMPIAIQYTANILAAPRDDREVHLYSLDFSAQTQFSLDQIEFDTKQLWSNYQRGVLDQFQKRGACLCGANILVQGNVPIGSGLSSSAAIEMATAVAVQSLNRLDLPMVELIKISQRAENQFVGMNCGIMDQFISGMGKTGMALLLDCRSLNFEMIPFPSETYSVMILNTRVKRELTGTEYNERRSQCEEGVRILKEKLPQIRALRDVSVSDFERYKSLLPGLVKNRCHHVIYENERTQLFANALKQKDTNLMGRTLLESHESLRDLYEVSCEELDLMVDLAMSVPGVIGSRMTGAGFGGCAIAMVKKGVESQVEEKIRDTYPSKTGIEPEIYISQPSEGATLLPPDSGV
jgi:galactokinase